MERILETERTYLRRMTWDDLDDLKEILQDEEVMYAYEHAFSDAEVRNWMETTLRRYEEDGLALYAVIDKETGEFLGQEGLTFQEVNGRRELEIGYLFKLKNWNKGYATEVAIALKEYACIVLGMEKVISLIRDTNLPSQKVAVRSGMVIEESFYKNYMGKDILHYVFAVYRQ
ncbi:MAG TPA: GNAT family N-acetyltransferase [Clostridiaceae bacterium]|nr:GNAT family N-acetyltransferase [Clostridiaceae bacterium]